MIQKYGGGKNGWLNMNKTYMTDKEFQKVESVFKKLYNMSKIKIIIQSQYWENYNVGPDGFGDVPYWKPKGG